MGLGNAPTYGNKASNGELDRRLLQLLDPAATNTILTAILAALGGAVVPETPFGPIRATVAGTVPVKARSASFYNAGTADATVNGGTLKQGEQITWSAQSGATFGVAIAYDGTGTTLVVNYTT